ncbi:hypothetical protein NCG97_12685 [Streptomyces lydicamycinicus]|uniref:hypothetical protein n=1 Tax=Streptomyces lydicamycinicus TaxID=1546107 RepID=UPI002034A823|nr:hypothetical protein [Streptomyces lydicamycinicus]USA05476.1 hypothetical protein NCG97_12685 [Streptomyces lydicamycinicus]
MIACTVLLSVLAHGLTSAPLANRYGRAAAGTAGGPTAPAEELRVRGMAAGGLHHRPGRK